MRSKLLAFGLVSLGIGLSACGGSVVVETTAGGDGGGGSGGAGGSSGVGGDAQQATCAKLCAVGAGFGCDISGDECIPSCLDGFASMPADCRDEYAAFLDCASAAIPQAGCELVDQCTGEAFAIGTCLGGASTGSGPGPDPGPGCDGSDCVGSDTSCACKGFCNGEARAVECSAQGDTFACTCSLDGSQVGTCTEPIGQSTFCDLEFGCCSAFF